MSFNQFRGNFRKGEPTDHLEAKNIIVGGLQAIGLNVQKEYPLLADLYHPYKHNYDVVAFGEIVIVEVDDPDLHNKPHKIRNDKIAQERAEETFPGTKFFRLNKHDVNLAYAESNEDWFAKELWNKIL